MERLRRTAAERAAKRAAEQRAAAQAAAQQQQQQQAAAGPGGGPAAAGAAAQATAPGELSDEMRERLGRTLKVSWSRKVSTGRACRLQVCSGAAGGVRSRLCIRRRRAWRAAAQRSQLSRP